MGGLGHYIEDEGVPTTQISLIREHTETIRPPRALWVPFILGRPLGQPNDPEFQKRVLRAALALLDEPAGPVLVDHLEEAEGELEVEGLTCPISYADPAPDDSLGSRLEAEVSSLQTWYDLALESTARTAFGVAGLDIGDTVRLLCSVAGGDDVPSDLTEGAEKSLGSLARFAAEDLKAFVTEAIAAQPGRSTAFALKAWFWERTVAGEALLEAYRTASRSEDKSLRGNAPSWVPAELR